MEANYDNILPAHLQPRIRITTHTHPPNMAAPRTTIASALLLLCLAGSAAASGGGGGATFVKLQDTSECRRVGLLVGGFGAAVCAAHGGVHLKGCVPLFAATASGAAVDDSAL